MCDESKFNGAVVTGVTTSPIGSILHKFAYRKFILCNFSFLFSPIPKVI